MNNKTPKNWITCKISDLCDFQNGYAFNSNDYVENGMPIIRMSNISVDGNINLTPENTKYYQTEKAETLKKYILNKNDVVMAMTDMTKDMGIIGKTAIIDEDNRYLLNQRVGRLTIKNSKVLDYKYLHRYTNSPLFLNYAKQQCSGGVQLNLSTKAILKHKMILPPTIQEQQEIAQVLDTMSDIIRLREECISHAQDLIPALFQEMFDNPQTNRKNLNKVKVGNILTLSSGKFLPAKEMDENGIYSVYGGNGINGHHNKYLFEEPQLCIGRVGVKCGCVHLTEPKSWITDNALYINKLLKSLNMIYLKEALTQINLNQYAKRAAQPVISQSTIYNQYILEPPIELQELFAQKAIEIESYIKEQQEELENAKQMFQSLLHHAFTGELTRHKFGGDANG